MDWFTVACDEWRERNGLLSHVITGVNRNATIACDEWTEKEWFFSCILCMKRNGMVFAHM